MAADLEKLKEHVSELSTMVKARMEKNKLAGDVTSHLEAWHTSEALHHLTGLFGKLSGHDHAADAAAPAAAAAAAPAAETPAPEAPAAAAPAPAADAAPAPAAAPHAEHEHHAAEHEHHAAASEDKPSA